MIFYKLRSRLIIGFCIGLLLNIINTSVSAINFPLESDTVSTQAMELVERGKRYYSAEQFQSAIKDLDEAVKIFETEKNTINQAIVLSNLSLAYQKLGQWDKAEETIKKSLALLNDNSENKVNNDQQNIIASSLNIYGGLLYYQGKLNLALNTWQETEKIYQTLGKIEGVTYSQINQIKALQSLGNYNQVVNLTQKIQDNLLEASPSLQVLSLKNLGEVLQSIGELNNAEEILIKSKELAEKNNLDDKIINSINLALGNNYWALGKLENERINPILQSDTVNYNLPWQCKFKPLSNQGKIYYQKAENIYQSIINKSNINYNSQKAKINLFNLLVEANDLTSAQTLLATINLEQLPSNQTNIYAKINFAKHLNCLSENNLIQTDFPEKILTQALKKATNLQDNRALGYSYGNLGGYYEYLSIISDQNQNNQLLITAKNLTEQALLSTQPSNNPEIAYQWQWQLGRIYDRLGNREKAINYYRSAVNSLTQVRRDLLGIATDVQFSFRDNVEPIYRELVGLLLSSEGDNPSQKTLVSARGLIDSLQLAELENFLNCDLGIMAQSTDFYQSNNSVFIYPIILPDRLDIIYQIPNQPLQYHSQLVNRGQVEMTVDTVRKAIARRNPEVLRENAGNLYQWLIQPLNSYISDKSGIKNLVFVLDGALRNVPMAILYDTQNQEYLVEKNYALSLLPTSQLFNLKPSNQSIKVLGAGISEALTVEKKLFTEINAQEELQKVKQIVSTETLINAQFTQQALQKQISQGNFSVLHLATHGNFSSDPQETYLLAYDKLLRANDLSNLLQISNQNESKAIDLLILSACQTATGDNRATLGLAGLAIRAGANSTLASLWRVSDEYSIPLITRFYENLNRGLSKAEALHQAQKSLVYTDINGQKYQNEPYDWGAYVLVGNWQ